MFFAHIPPPKVATEPKFKHNPYIKPRRLLYFLLGKGQSKGFPEVKVRSQKKITLGLEGMVS